MLHPRHKLDYFHEANWEADWITAAKNIVRDIWDDHYRCRPLPTDDDSDAEVDSGGEKSMSKVGFCKAIFMLSDNIKYRLIILILSPLFLLSSVLHPRTS